MLSPVLSQMAESTSDSSLRRAQAGDTEAFADLVADAQRVVVATAIASVGDPALGQEIAQDAFLLAWRKIDSIRPGAFRAYACSSARKIARNRRRKLQPRALARGRRGPEPGLRAG